MTDIFMFLPPASDASAYAEEHPYGPFTSAARPSSPGTPFQDFYNDLGVLVNAGLRDSLFVRAVVAGTLGVIPYPVVRPRLPLRGTLVLRPAAPIQLNVPWMSGELDIVFIYRNVLFFEASRGRYFPTSTRSVAAGEELGTAAPGNDSQGYLGFGIAFASRAFNPSPGIDRPSGALVGEGWRRLQSLIEPQLVLPTGMVTAPGAFSLRYLDPAAFYAALANALTTGTTGDQLNQLDANHPMFGKLTARTLLEVRDEHDRPFVGHLRPIGADRGDGIEATFTARDRGIVVLGSPAQGIQNHSATDYVFSQIDHLLTLLPSGERQLTGSPISLVPPAHVAVQTIFMKDADDPSNWFVENLTPLPRFTTGNTVTPIRDGIAGFQEMGSAMRAVSGSNGLIWIVGWYLQDDFPLLENDPTSSFLELSRAAAQNGATIRVLLWQASRANSPWGPNRDTAGRINGVSNSKALLDGDTNLTGSHHQKFLIVRSQGPTGVQDVAFCGGLDINPDRLDDDTHCVQGKFHDVHAKIEGPAISDLVTTFVQRWNHAQGSDDLQPYAIPTAPGTHIVQVTRTYPKKDYPFAPAGDVTTLKALRHAITLAQRFIYIEDQYLFPYAGPFPFSGSSPYVDADSDSVGILTDLLTALARPQFEYLLMMISNHVRVPQSDLRRAMFIKSLTDRFPSKVHFYYLGRTCSDAVTKRDVPGPPPPPPYDAPDMTIPDDLDPTSESVAKRSSGASGMDFPDEVYVHTKSWIIDDVYAMIGSANCCRRSMTNDSECSIHFTDAALLNGARAVVRNYRMDLWAEHLNMQQPDARAMLEDPTLALHFWKNPVPGARQRPYALADIPSVFEAWLAHPRSPNTYDTEWSVIDPDGR